MTHRKTGVNRTRRIDFTGDFFGQAYGNRRNARCFNDALNQSHGLIADASGRRQDHHIDTIPLQQICNLWCRLI